MRCKQFHSVTSTFAELTNVIKFAILAPILVGANVRTSSFFCTENGKRIGYDGHQSFKWKFTIS